MRGRTGARFSLRELRSRFVEARKFPMDNREFPGRAVCVPPAEARQAAPAPTEQRDFSILHPVHIFVRAAERYRRRKICAAAR